jgi:hypothetical protein
MAEPHPSQRVRRPSERVALVEYIAASPTLQENEHLEWKSGYDLSQRPGAGKVAKQLIGFANRDPARAQRMYGGYAYLLLGVEAGTIKGVPVWDSADIEGWLSRFVPSELMYDVHYVSLSGKNVLLLEVEPSRAGDSIFCLQSSTGDGKFSLTEGTIYVRRGGKTEVANASEIGLLTTRARSGGSSGSLDLNVEIESQNLNPLDPRILAPPIPERWVETTRPKLMKGIPDRPSLISTIGESRSPATAREQIRAYLQEITARWPTFALSRHVEQHEPSLTLAVANRTDENFESVLVELVVPLPISCVGSSAKQVAGELSVAELPPKWGEFDVPKLSRNIFGSLPEPEYSVAGEDQTKVRFPPIHVYPQTTHPLDSLTLALAPEWSASDLAIEWRATAANTRGLLSGEVVIPIPSAGESGSRSADSKPAA